MKPKLLLIAPLLLACPLACPAYEYYENWLGNTKKWLTDNPQIRAKAFPVGSALRDALVATVDSWNLNPSDFRFDLTFDEGRVSINNEQSEIWFTDDDDLLDGFPAITYWVFSGVLESGREILAADILFDRRLSWETTTSRKSRLFSYGGGSRPFQTTLLHELGHALGLDHENDEYNIMGTDWTHLNANGDAVRFYPGEDACDGAVFLYSLNAVNLEDVSVTHWKYSGRSGEYSTHVRTLITDTDDNALATTTPADLPTATVFSDPIYRVNRGQEVKLEFTLENSGASSQTPLVHFVLSNDSWIGPDDTLLDTRHPTVRRSGDVYTTSQTLTIPDDLTRGQTYFLGIIVDPDNTIAEVREDNNATYVGIRIE